MFHVCIQSVDVPALVKNQGDDLVPHIPHNLIKEKNLRGKSIGGYLSNSTAITAAATGPASPLAPAPAPPLAPAAVAGNVNIDENNIQLVHMLTHKQSYLLNRIDDAPSPVIRPCIPDRCSKIRGDEGYHLFVDTYFIFDGSPKKQTG